MKKRQDIVTALVLILLLLITIFFLSSISSSNEVLNGGFENLDSNFQPLNWGRAGRPFVNIDNLNAHSGMNSAKISSNNYYTQDISASENLAYTLGTYIKGDTGNETAIFTLKWRINNELVYNYNSWGASVENEYCLYLFNFLSPWDTYSSAIINRTGLRYDWVYEDDVFFVDEILDNGGFETSSTENPSHPKDWQNVGNPYYDKSGANAHSGSSAVAVNSNNYYSQDISIATPNKTYVISFWAKAQSSPVQGVVSIEAVDYSANIIYSPNFQFNATTNYQLFRVSIVPPEDAVLLKISLKSQNLIQSIFYDDIHFFFHSPYPDNFSPNNDDLRETTDIYFLLDVEADVSIDIYDNHNNFIEKLLNNVHYSRGVHSVVWDGINKEISTPLPDGTYKYTLTINTAESNNITSSGNIVIDTSYKYSQSSASIDDFFPVGIWFTDEYGALYYPGYYAITLNDIAQHNFNTVIVNGFSNDNAPEMLTAAESNNLKILYNDLDLQMEIYNAVYFEPLNENLIRNRAQELINLVGSSPSLLGYYLFDEPQFIEAQDVKLLKRILEDFDPIHPSFCAFYPNTQMDYTFRTIGLNVLIIDYYVTNSVTQSIGNMGGFIAKLEEIENMGLNKNVPTWIILQGFSQIGTSRQPTSEETRCQTYLSIAHNFKGLFYFLYQTLNDYYLQGLADIHQNPSELYDSLTQLNAELIILSPIILDLTPYEFTATTSSEALVKTFKDSDNIRYLILVNTDCTESNNITVETEDIGIKKVVDVLYSTEIPFTTNGSQINFNINLPPGDGRILKLSNSLEIENWKYQISNLKSPISNFPSQILNQSFQSYHTLQPANGIAFQNNYAFISEASNTIEIVDISDPQNIQYVTKITGYNTTNLLIDNNKLFIADNQYGLAIYDISNINTPQFLGKYIGHTGNASDVRVANNMAFIASGSKGLKILDITDPINITQLGFSGNAYDSTSLEIRNNYAFLTDLTDGLIVCDFSNLSAPTVVAKVDTFAHALDIKLDNDNAFIAANEYGLVIIDISNPASPSVIGTLRTRSAYNLDKYGQFVFLADGTGGLKIIDCEDLSDPKLFDEYKILKTEIVRDVKIYNGFAFIAYGNAGIVSVPLRELIPTIVPEKFWRLY